MGWTKTPNGILDAVPDMSEIEVKLTMVLVRATFGYHRDEVKMTYDDMQEATNIRGRASITRAINLVEKRGFFVRGRKSMWTVNSSIFELNPPPEIVHEEDFSSNIELKNSSNIELDYSSNIELSPLYINKDLPKVNPEKKERVSTPPPLPDDDGLQIAWETAVLIANWFREQTGQSVITGKSLKNGQRDKLVAEFIEPANVLWVRFDRDINRTQVAILKKYHAMLQDGLRPRRLSAIVPQIFGDLDAGQLPPKETAVSPPHSAPAEQVAVSYARRKQEFFNEQ